MSGKHDAVGTAECLAAFGLLRGDRGGHATEADEPVAKSGAFVGQRRGEEKEKKKDDDYG